MLCRLTAMNPLRKMINLEQNQPDSALFYLDIRCYQGFIDNIVIHYGQSRGYVNFAAGRQRKKM